MASISSWVGQNLKHKRYFFNLGVFHRLTAAVIPRFVTPMQRIQLKSKLHRAIIKQADIDYEVSIEIPSDLMKAAGLW